MKEETESRTAQVGRTFADCLVQSLLRQVLASKLAEANDRPQYHQLVYPKQLNVWARHVLSMWTQYEKGMGSQ